MNFIKMQGTGNDFVVIEDLENELAMKENSMAAELCDRHFGVGADGILIVRNSYVADIQMVIINADGSYAAMCGNGIRCFAKYVWENKLVPQNNNITIETGDGVKEAIVNSNKGEVKSITINMGKPSIDPIDIPTTEKEEIINKSVVINEKQYFLTSMLMGVPHTVVLGELDKFKTCEGAEIEKLDIFPQKTNVNFCEVLDRNNIKVKTWERGAGATLACGTGSCACAVACNKLGYIDKEVAIQVPGGLINVNINEKGVLMTGPAEVVFKGTI